MQLKAGFGGEGHILTNGCARASETETVYVAKKRESPQKR